MASSNEQVLLAVIGAPHGIRGDLRVNSFTSDPLALGKYGTLRDVDGNQFDVISVRPAKNVVVVRFKQVTNRTAAEQLKGTELFIDRSALPDHGLDEDEFFNADLVGMKVESADGTDHGVVVALQNFGAGDIVELKPRRGQTVMIPFSEAAILAVDFETGRVLVDPMAAGLTPEDESGPGSRRRRPGPRTGSAKGSPE